MREREKEPCCTGITSNSDNSGIAILVILVILMILMILVITASPPRVYQALVEAFDRGTR